MRHLVRRELAEQHGAGGVEPARRRGILRGNPVDEDARVGRREDALRVVDVLEREGDPVQCPPVLAGRDVGLGRPGLPAGQVERARDERTRLPVVPLDALDQRLDQLHGRELARRDLVHQLGNREEVVELGRHGVVLLDGEYSVDGPAGDATLGPGQGGGTMAFMVKDGFRLYYEDTGGNAPTLLFLHGAGGNHLSWWQQVPVFAEEYRCLAVDQRGFGQSPDVSGGPGPTALATDAIALLDHLGIVRAALVAQSMGGWAAVGAAVHSPARF